MIAPDVRVWFEANALRVSGRVTADTVLAVREAGEQIIAGANRALGVNLDALESAHSVVLSLLLCWERLARQRGVALSYSGASSRLMSLAALSNLDDHLSGFTPHQASDCSG